MYEVEVPVYHFPVEFQSSAKTCNQGLAALSMVSLRNSHNCKLLGDNNVAELIVQAMKIHPTMKKLLVILSFFTFFFCHVCSPSSTWKNVGNWYASMKFDLYSHNIFEVGRGSGRFRILRKFHVLFGKTSEYL